MVDVSTIQALDHELSREAKVFAYLKCLLVDVLSREIFCDAAIVCVGKLSSVNLIVEEVVNINIVHITLDALQIGVL